MVIKANLVDIINKKITPSKVEIVGQKIVAIHPIDEVLAHFILPGFIDAHIHIESSMLLPSEFAKVAVLHGTVATVSDPHEIANVMGIDGVRYMIENSKTVPFHFFFGAPSCVPATSFETAGSTINADGIQEMMQWPEIYYLAEVMNYPAVIGDDEEIMNKISAAHQVNKPVDGHAPGVTGDALKKYLSAGITTDHECFTYEEGLEKVKLGCKILIREGSAAKNYEALIPLLKLYPTQIMFCSDDKHPDDLMIGHINQLVQRAIKEGYELFDVLYAACILPVLHYKLPVGTLNIGDNADFIMVKDLTSFEIVSTYLHGECVAQKEQSFISTKPFKIINQFNCDKISEAQLKIKANTSLVRVIEARNKQLVTGSIHENAILINGELTSNIEKDILKIVVVNRYHNAPPSIAFIKNFGLKNGAIASCVAHDSHNIVAVGANDTDLMNAINLIIENKGGISLANLHDKQVLPLPVAGIMSNCSASEIANGYTELHLKAKELGCHLDAPFMSLSFMALLVIPSLKISDKGLFDGNQFAFTSVVV